MSREILQDIIDDFSPEKFTRFFREKHRSFSPRHESFPQDNDTAFVDGMKFGEIQFPEIEKLIACAFKATQPLSERSSRKAQYDKGKKILKETNSDAGIFIFYDTQGSFRFSLIYPEAVGTRRQWSNFRRFTYFVSPELTNKTFLARVGDGDFTSLDKIKDAFSVEKVTKEFYEQYRKLFEALLGDLNKNRAFQIVASKSQINTPDFAKKLLGQIVFLYFLQKKGWLGVPQDKRWGDGDKNFISNLYKQAVKKSENFYNDYLEVLFYDTLNNASREGADPSFSRYFNCRIPFLNGGLFEPGYDWHGTKIYLENGVFKNIFEVFDRYNFTVEEESPDDKEVAVDPEMLGKVFENLLEENLRKGKGTYYTPREIVHYMCRESLVNYLVSQSGFEEEKVRGLILRHESGFSTDEGKTLEQFLKDIKICDPACGSGAFLVGMLTEIVGARLILDPAGSEYGLKKETIQSCIYGVDIDPGAVEIAKLRLWLSLVVDYELADIEPLPNLDYKIMCGNSLLEELIVGDESVSLFDPGVLGKDKPKRKSSDKLMQMDFLKQDAEEYLKILRKLHVEYFHETDTQKKKTLRSRIEKIEMDFIQASVDSRVKEIDGRIKNLNMQKPEDRKKNAELMKKKLEYMAIPGGIRDSKVRPYFLWHLNFFEVFQDKGGFDITIGNPPYVRADVDAEHARMRRMILGGGQYETLWEKWDLYVAFMERAYKLLCHDGITTLIISDAFCHSKYAQKPQKWYLNNARILRLDFCGELKIFEAAVHNLIYFFQRAEGAHHTPERRGHFETFGNASELPSDEQGKLTYRAFFPESTIRQSFVCKTVMLDVICYITYGLRPNSDEKEAKGEFKTADIVSETRDSVHCRPYVEGKHLGPWLPENNLWIEWGTARAPSRFCRPTFPELYTVSKKILAQRSPGPDPVVCFDDQRLVFTPASVGLIPWYALYNVRNNSLKKSARYHDEKPLRPDLPKREELEAISRRFHVKYLLGVMNSSVARNFLRANRRSNIHLYPDDWKKLPIPDVPLDEQVSIVKLVGRILTTKQRDPRSDITSLEHQIDQMVYKLYGLTEEEIAIVEESGAK